MNGFKVSGIFPFNREVFSDVDFAPCTVTDRPDPNMNVPTPENESDNSGFNVNMATSGIGDCTASVSSSVKETE